MTKPGLLLVLSLAFGAAHADSRLHGAWAAANADNGALKGTLSFTSTGKATLHPEGFEVLTGSYEVKADQLSITLGEHGTSMMHFEFNTKKQLVLTYDNGNKQVFDPMKTKPNSKKK